MASLDGNKRRRRSPASSPSPLASLPDEIWANVSHYLPKPSAAFLAAALTAPPAAWREANWRLRPSPKSEAIVASHGWETLDFRDVHSDCLYETEQPQPHIRIQVHGGLGRIMTDDDLGAALACIGAAQKLKKLVLSGCKGISGGGLEPLRGSSSLQQLDMAALGIFLLEDLRRSGRPHS